MSGLLLDTNVVLRIGDGEGLGARAKTTIDEATAAGEALISPISAWEIGTLIRKRRINLRMDPLVWFEAVLSLPGVKLADMPPRVLMSSTLLPPDAPSDPADRIIIATARTYNLVVLTRDLHILAYADAGHLNALSGRE